MKKNSSNKLGRFAARHSIFFVAIAFILSPKSILSQNVIVSNSVSVDVEQLILHEITGRFFETQGFD